MARRPAPATLTEQPHLYQFDLGQGDGTLSEIDASPDSRDHPPPSACVAVIAAVTAVSAPAPTGDEGRVSADVGGGCADEILDPLPRAFAVLL